MYIPNQPERPRHQVPLRSYLEDLLRYPARTLSNIALDRPWVRGGGLLLAGFALVGLALGATGLPGLGKGLPGALRGALFVPAIGAIAFLAISLVYHGMAKYLEGWASYPETVSALIFAYTPLLLLAPSALLRLAPGAWGGLLFFSASVAIVIWTLRLVYLALRESHRFTGTQSILTMTVPLTIALLAAFMGLIVTAMVLLVVGS